MEKFYISTPSKTILVNITSHVREIIADRRFTDGICHIFIPHTTAGITINESADPDVKSDVIMEMIKIIPFQDSYQHAEGNSAAHIKASIIGSSESIFIEKAKDCYRASGRQIKGSFPIQGLYRLMKDKKVYLEKLPLSRALCELFTVPGLLKGLTWHEKLLANFSQLVAKVPCFNLHFKRDSSFWRCIDEHVS